MATSLMILALTPNLFLKTVKQEYQEFKNDMVAYIERHAKYERLDDNIDAIYLASHFEEEALSMIDLLQNTPYPLPIPHILDIWVWSMNYLSYDYWGVFDKEMENIGFACLLEQNGAMHCSFLTNEIMHYNQYFAVNELNHPIFEARYFKTFLLCFVPLICLLCMSKEGNPAWEKIIDQCKQNKTQYEYIQQRFNIIKNNNDGSFKDFLAHLNVENYIYMLKQIKHYDGFLWFLETARDHF